MAVISRGPDKRSIIPFTVMGVPLNSTGDKATFVGIPPNTTYVIDTLELWGFSAQPGILLSFSLRDQPAGAGTNILAAAAGLNLIVGGINNTLRLAPLAATLGSNQILTATTLYFNVGVANATALTANVTMFLRILSI